MGSGEESKMLWDSSLWLRISIYICLCASIQMLLPRLASTHQIFVHFNDLSTLTNDATVDHCLVVWLDGGRVMQDFDFGLKIINTNGRYLFVKHNHTLSEPIPLQSIFLNHTFNCKANCLSCKCLINWKSLVVDGSYLDWLE